FPRPLGRGAQDDPAERGVGEGGRQPPDGGTAADLDVVGVRAEQEHLAERRREGRADHTGSRVAAVGARSAQTSHGARPAWWSSHSISRSLNVSMPAQKPWWRYVVSWPSAMSRWKGSTTSSSPGRM